MGRLKNKLFYEVWFHLWNTPQKSTLIHFLTSPTNGPPQLRAAWAELQTDAGRMEGWTRKLGLQAILAERPDLFQFRTNEKSHRLIELTPAARDVRPTEDVHIEGVSPPQKPDIAAPPIPHLQQPVQPLFPQPAVAAGQTTTALALAEVDPLSAALGALNAAESPAGEALGGMLTSSEVQPVGLVVGTASAEIAESLAKRARTTPAPPNYVEAQKMWGGGVRPGHFQDLIWTPLVAAAREQEKAKDGKMARALINAMEQNAPGAQVGLSQLGADYEVAQIKKDSLFKNLKLLDILRRYEQFLEISTDGLGAGTVVRLQPDARIKLGEAGWSEPAAYAPNGERLPDRIDNPSSPRDKMQALRIELLHALCRRGGKCAVQELGQEPRVQRIKAGLTQAKKLLDFVKMFPANFHVRSDDPLQPQMMIEVASANVDDREMIDLSILKQHQAALGPMSGRGGFGNRGQDSRFSSNRAPIGGGASSGYGGGGGFDSRGYRDNRGFSSANTASASQTAVIQAAWRDAAAAAVAQAQAYAQAAQYGAMAQQMAAAQHQPAIQGFHSMPPAAAPPSQPGFQL